LEVPFERVEGSYRRDDGCKEWEETERRGGGRGIGSFYVCGRWEGKKIMRVSELGRMKNKYKCK
jgi:hypothetical protein